MLGGHGALGAWPREVKQSSQRPLGLELGRPSSELQPREGLNSSSVWAGVPEVFRRKKVGQGTYRLLHLDDLFPVPQAEVKAAGQV